MNTIESKIISTKLIEVLGHHTGSFLKKIKIYVTQTIHKASFFFFFKVIHTKLVCMGMNINKRSWGIYDSVKCLTFCSYKIESLRSSDEI